MRLPPVQCAVRRRRDDRERVGSFLVVDLAGLTAYPAQVRRRVHHRECDPAREESHCRIRAGRPRDRADPLEWTAHLMTKTWLPSTDWHDVLREARAGGERLTVTAP
ncbi:hypothetical protein [Streptomyces europaeiscabiei]|uniref:hypothetical protein n=1 Tax=Streptomyces europaeiscabiei TaxID=146819 RepID=UPI002E1802F5